MNWRPSVGILQHVKYAVLKLLSFSTPTNPPLKQAYPSVCPFAMPPKAAKGEYIETVSRTVTHNQYNATLLNYGVHVLGNSTTLTD